MNAICGAAALIRINFVVFLKIHLYESIVTLGTLPYARNFFVNRRTIFSCK